MFFDYFYEEQSESYSFYRIPKMLFTEEIFEALSTDAKVLYGLLLDEAIITPEVFDEAQRLKEKRSTVKKDEHGNIIRKGQSPCKNVWAAKCRCTCGHAMNRRLAHKSKTGDTSFIFQCYGQLRTGTPAMRLKRGLDIEGICDNTTFMQWRLDIMADFIFKKLITNRQAIYDEAIAMAGDLLEVRMTDGSSDKDKVENNIKQIDKLKKQIAVLVDMCTEGDISREVFRQKKQKLEDQIINLEKTNNECKQQILESEDDKLKQRRIESLTEFIKMQAFDPRAKIPETMIDVFVDRIVYDKGVFSWYLNPKLGNETFKVDTTDWKKSMLKSQKKTLPAHTSTGSNR